MKKFLAPAAIVLSIGLLSACNPLSLLGPIEAVDPLGLAGQEMTATITTTEPDLEATSDQLAAKSSEAWVKLEKTFTFDDPKDLPATPDILNLGLVLSGVKIGGTGCKTALPDTITGNVARVHMLLKDEQASIHEHMNSIALTLSKQATGGYSMVLTGATQLDAKLPGVAALIGNKISPNSGNIRLKMRFDNGTDLSGCEVTATFGSAKSSFQF
jgi:hypothetical protein